MASTQCPRFIQNAWKKDLCSNCFKSKEEHAAILQTIRSIPTTPLKILSTTPAKSIIKTSLPLSKKNKKKSVNFSAAISEVIGEGGEWLEGSEEDDDDDDDIPDNNGEELVYNDDEDLQTLTKTNTEFNMNNGNLLGDPTVNIKRSFAALKLGAPQKDATGKKQTLKISVTPFGGVSSSASAAPPTASTPSKLETKAKVTAVKINNSNDLITRNNEVTVNKDEVDKSQDFDIKINTNSEKSLLEEISETLLSKKILVNETQAKSSILVNGKNEMPKNDVIKVEIKNKDSVTSAIISSSDSVTNVSTNQSTNNLNSINNKRTITRNNAILKDMEKPKIHVANDLKHSESSESDLECSTTSDYYDVVETQNSYENVADGMIAKGITETVNENCVRLNKTANIKDSISNDIKITASNAIMDMFVTHHKDTKAKKRTETYDLVDNTFVSSKITSDGLIVTKNHMEDALDSTGSSFDSSSDEEMSNGRSESDSGIVIKGTNSISSKDQLNTSNNSSDYEDIQVTNEINKALANNREIPDGRSDPDGSSETSPPPASQNIDPRQSFLHSTANKPKVPIKPVSVNVVKPFQKRNAEIIMQLQQVIGNKEKSLSSDSLDLKTPKKSRAPEPPQNIENESQNVKLLKSEFSIDDEPLKSFKEFVNVKSKFSSKNGTVQLKETRNYPAINPKFRSLNHLNKAHEAQEKLDKFESFQNSTPEPAPRHSLSLSTDSLTDLEKGLKKKKFSIKKFLRMGNSSSKAESTPKKDYSHYADIPTSPSDDPYNAPQVKPRLIIIHPLDINNTGVEVVSSSTIQSTDKNQSQSGHKKPPVPPNRSDSTKLEMNKPTRPPPPKSNELRTNTETSAEKEQKVVTKTSSDTVYANLGEIRNSIAPRKPERTNSMRERETKALEVKRRQPVGESENELIENNEKNDDDHIEAYKNEDSIITKAVLKASSPPAVNNNDGKKKLPEIENVSTRSKIELFENNALKNETKTFTVNKSSSPSGVKQTTFFVNSDGLKSSVQKMNLTIDSYLKNKKLISSSDSNLLDNSRSPTPPQQQIIANVSSPLPLIGYNGNNVRSPTNLRTNANYEPINVNVSAKINYQRSSYPDNGMCSPVLTFGNATRSYCGSEIGESEIYSPYSFCGSDAALGLDISQNDLTDGCQGSSRNKIVSRLRMRKGRSVVHTNLEDNYSAVIVANHEALAQVLDQLQQPQPTPAPLRPLANSLNLRFDDFMILDSIGLVVGRRVFHQALWQNSIYVTLVLTSDSNQMVSGNKLNQLSGGISGALNPITEFCDLVPNNYLPSMPTTKVQMVQATITILPKMQVETLETMGSMMKSKINNNSLFGCIAGSDDNSDTISINDKSPTGESPKTSPNKNGLFDDLLCREVGFIILQLVNGLKNMQAKGVEEMPMSLSNIIMCREVTENKDQQARLCILQGINSDLSREDDEVMGTLCQCALKVIKEVLPETKLTQLLSDLLIQERADTLSKIKSVLEYVLWGPSDVPMDNGPLRERELTLQRWLDLARATVLHGLVRTKIDLTIFDECHLIFLVRSNSKIMLDASQIIASSYHSSSN